MTRLDAEAQTDTHLLESNIVKSYEWNEWELRRQALKLVCAAASAAPPECFDAYTVYMYSIRTRMCRTPTAQLCCAVLQANLRRKVTKSMQTNLSNLRRDNSTQVYLPKYAPDPPRTRPAPFHTRTVCICKCCFVMHDTQLRSYRREKTTQTKTDATTSVPKPSVFYYGLRGHARTGPTEPAAATLLTAVDLTLNVDSHLERSIPIPPAAPPAARATDASAAGEREKTDVSGSSAKSSSRTNGEQVERSAEEDEFYATIAKRLENGEDVGQDEAPDGGDGVEGEGNDGEGGDENDGAAAAVEASGTEGAQTERSTDTVTASEAAAAAAEGGD